MKVIKPLRTEIARIAEALEGMDNPTGDYMFALGRRVDMLERKVEQLERQLHWHASDRGIKPQTPTATGNEAAEGHDRVGVIAAGSDIA